MLGTYERLGVHIYASNLAVIRAARKKIARKHRTAPAMRNERKKFYRMMMRYHKEARDLARQFRL